MTLPKIALVEAPLWGEGLPPATDVPPSSASLGDMLAIAGLCSADWIRRQIEGWRSLFSRYKPDLIVAEYAPGAVLAARGQIPCVAIGAGFSVPPSGVRFPVLHALSPIVFDENHVRETVNAVLAEFSAAPLARLADCLIGDRAFVCTLPLIDPYRAWRERPAMGVLFPDPVVRSEPSADQVFCYMRAGPAGDLSPLVAASLRKLPARATVFLPSLSDAEKADLRATGVEVLEGIVPLTEPLQRCRLVVHGGGHGVATAAIVAGVPQLVVDFDIEKTLTAEALVSRGIAQRVEHFRATADTLRTAILSALDDPVLASEAERAAVEHEAYRERDVASEIAEACIDLAA